MNEPFETVNGISEREDCVKSRKGTAKRARKTGPDDGDDEPPANRCQANARERYRTQR